MRISLDERERRHPIDASDIDEAASLYLELGSRERAIARYNQLIALDTDVTIRSAALLKQKIERADEIHAWSNSLTMFPGAGDASSDALQQNDTDKDVVNSLNDVQKIIGIPSNNKISDYPVDKRFIVGLLLPNSVTVVEAYKRLKKIGSGLIGYHLGVVPTQALTGMAYFGADDAYDVYNSLEYDQPVVAKDPDKSTIIGMFYRNRKSVLFRQDENTVRYIHGDIDITAPYPYVAVMLAALYNVNLRQPLYYLADGTNKTSVTTSMSVESFGLAGYTPNGDANYSHDFILFRTGHAIKDNKKQKQIGDFKGIHFFTGVSTPNEIMASGLAWLGIGAIAETAATGGVSAVESLARTAFELRWKKSQLTSWEKYGPHLAYNMKQMVSPTNFKKNYNFKTLGKRILPKVKWSAVVDIGVMVLSFTVGATLATVSGRCDRFIDPSILLDIDGLAQPDSEYFTLLANSPEGSLGPIESTKGYHNGFVQKTSVVPSIVKDLNAGEALVPKALSRGWVSLVNGCMYEV